MHLYAITRGVKWNVDLFINELSGKYLPFKWRFPNTKEIKDCAFKLGVRPIQLWEFAFPESSKDQVLATILGDNKGKCQHSKHQKLAWALQKALRVDGVPDYKIDQKFPCFKEAIEVVGIGIKDDYWMGPNDEHFTKEEYEKLPEEIKKLCYEAL